MEVFLLPFTRPDASEMFPEGQNNLWIRPAMCCLSDCQRGFLFFTYTYY